MRIRLIALTVISAAMATSACDPYPATPAPDPRVLAVFATFVDPTTGAGQAVDGAETAGTWTVEIPGNFVPGDVAPPDRIQALEPVIVVRTNTLLDGTSVEASGAVPPCTPQDGWLTASPVPPGSTWYSCFYPSTPSAQEGSSLVLFASAVPISTDAGWFSVAALPASETADTAYALSGSVADPTGRPLALSIAAVVKPPPGQPGPLAVGAVTSASVDLSWGAAPPSPTAPAGYAVQRTGPLAGAGPPVPDPAGWTVVGTPQGTSFTDATVAATSAYFYRVVAVSAGGGASRPTAAVGVTTP